MTLTFDRRRWLLAGVASLSNIAGPVAAQPGAAPRIAVLSLFGAELHVVTRKPQTGSNLIHNDVQIVSMGGVVDRAALDTAEKVLLKMQRLEPVLLTSTSPSLHKQQERFFADARVTLPEAFLKAAREDGATLLVLLTRHRGGAQFRIRDGWVGQGSVEGAGFYIDLVEPLKDWQQMEARNGYLGAYAYIRMTLVDLATMRIVREQQLQGNGIVLQSTGDGSLNPWGALTNEKKMELLNRVVAEELERALPQLLAGR